MKRRINNTINEQQATKHVAKIRSNKLKLNIPDTY